MEWTVKIKLENGISMPFVSNQPSSRDVMLVNALSIPFISHQQPSGN